MAYAKFTPEMKKTYTILAPNMLPIHFHLLIRILEQIGYHVVLLESTSRTVVEEGLKNVHNDTCYPALLVVGQFPDRRRLPCVQLYPPAAEVHGGTVPAGAGALPELCRTGKGL